MISKVLSKLPRSLTGLIVVLSLLTATGTGFAQTFRHSVMLFADDFSGNNIGAEPSAWNITNATRAIGTIEVVEDSDIYSGRAAYFGVDVTDPARTTSMSANLLETAAADAIIVVVDFAVKWIEGGGINVYLSKGNTHHVNLFISEAVIGYRASDGDGRTRSIQVGQLKPGWNQVRLVANGETSQAWVFLNDMDTPVIDGERFRNSIDSWEGTRFIISHTTVSPGKALYGDINITGWN